MNRHRDIAAAALVDLPRATPRRLRMALRSHGGPEGLVAAISEGALDEDLKIPIEVTVGWRRSIELALARAAAILSRRQTRVLVVDDPDWPIPDDTDTMPAVLFVEGSANEALSRVRVAIVGTRNPTPHGAADARELGAAIADAGGVVVSGLAYGIDGAAHEGALEAGGLTIGVAATGLDVPYPSGHAALWTRVRNQGVIVGENSFGTPPTREVFPIRNRIIVALSSCVIIPEAAVKGGTMTTARAAMFLGRDVYAVPGSRRNPMAEGCNRLLADGAHPLVDTLDVEVALGRTARVSVLLPRSNLDTLSVGARSVYTALGGEPATLDQLVGRTGHTVAVVAGATRELERVGRLRRSGGRLWPM